jgi:hypothetical protein
MILSAVPRQNSILCFAKTLSGPDNADFDESALTITGGAGLPVCSPVVRQNSRRVGNRGQTGRF